MDSVSTTLEVYGTFIPTLASVIAQFTAKDEDNSGSTSSQSVSILSYLSSEITQTRQDFLQWRADSGPAANSLDTTGPSQDSGGGSGARPAESRGSVEGETNRMPQFLSNVESLIEMLLMSVQNVVQAEVAVSHTAENTDDAEGNQEEENEEEGMVQEHVFFRYIF